MNLHKRLLFLLVTMALLSGCRAETTVSIKVEEAGNGTVTVAVTFDDEAWLALEGSQDLRLDDLGDAGWLVVGPNTADDGSVSLSGSKVFDSPKQLGEVLAEVSGANGPYSRLGLSQTNSFGRSSYRLEGVLDGSMGVLGLADTEVTEALGGLPFGTDLDALETSLGQPLGSLIALNLHVDLPGAHATDAPGWSTNLAADVPLGVLTTSKLWHVKPLLLAAASILFAVIFVLLIMVKLVSVARRKGRRVVEPAQVEKPTKSPSADVPARTSGLQLIIFGGSTLVFDDAIRAETLEFIQRVQYAGFRVAYFGVPLLGAEVPPDIFDTTFITKVLPNGEIDPQSWEQLWRQTKVAAPDCLFISASEHMVDQALVHGYPTALFDPAGIPPANTQHTVLRSFAGLLTG